MATVAERIDPNSPHYDAKFAEMRRKAFAAWDGHVEDMKTDPEYRQEVEKRFGHQELPEAVSKTK